MGRTSRAIQRVVGAPRRLAALPGENRSLRAELAQRRREVEKLTAKLARRDKRIARLITVVKELRIAQLHRVLPERSAQLAEAVIAEGLTLLSPQSLTTLVLALLDVEAARVPGIVIEAGTARGGSAIVLAGTKAPERAMKVFDVFGLIPPPGAQDGQDAHSRYQKIREGKARGAGEETYYGYHENLFDEVTESFARHGLAVESNEIQLIPGFFEDTIQLEEPVAFAHIDGDWYESTYTCLQRITPWLSVGGRLVIDDYYAWSGCRRAVDEFFEGRPGFDLQPGQRLQVVRIAES